MDKRYRVYARAIGGVVVNPPVVDGNNMRFIGGFDTLADALEFLWTWEALGEEVPA